MGMMRLSKIAYIAYKEMNTMIRRDAFRSEQS